MEIAEREEKLLVPVGLGALADPFVRKGAIQAEQVSFESLGRLSGHFHATLKDGDGEFGMGRATQPEPEFFIGLVKRNFLDDLLQLRHPADGKMTIGKEHPVPILDTIFDHSGSDGCLALSKGNALQVSIHSPILRKEFKLALGVNSRREDEDEGDAVGRVAERLAEVKSGGLDELLTQVADDERAHSADNTVRAERAHDDEALQLVALVFPFAR
mmetsp:Transcript_33935/g.87128  ORF Transcript_33935/g.87128 Transcript_33935/m.87128 type:complete len:215 (-) Transcript_33935:564-1208(-)